MDINLLIASSHVWSSLGIHLSHGCNLAHSGSLSLDISFSLLFFILGRHMTLLIIMIYYVNE